MRSRAAKTLPPVGRCAGGRRGRCCYSSPLAVACVEYDDSLRFLPAELSGGVVSCTGGSQAPDGIEDQQSSCGGVATPPCRRLRAISWRAGVSMRRVAARLHTNFTNTPEARPRRSRSTTSASRAASRSSAPSSSTPTSSSPASPARPSPRTPRATSADIAAGAARPRARVRARSPTSSTASSSACSPRTSACCPNKLFTRIVDNARRRPRRASAASIGQLFDAMANGGDFGARDHPPLQRQPVRRRRRRPPPRPRTRSTASSPPRASTGAPSTPRSSAPSSSAASTPPSAPSSAPTTPAARTSRRSSSRSSCSRSAASGPTPGSHGREPASPPARRPPPAATDEAHRRRRSPEGEARGGDHPRTASSTRLPTVKVLDPACGSGNFLYVTLQKLKDLEKEVILFAMEHGLGSFPRVGPWQLYGIEINPYAHDLAQMTVWIGCLQWIRFNGFEVPADPILRPMDNFRCMDAILDLSDPARPKEPEWPAVDFIVGNPPFLGDKLLRGRLGDDYVNRLLRNVLGPRPEPIRPLLLLVREGAGADRSAQVQARRPARDPGHPRRREPEGPQAHQANRRHLLG